MFVVRVQCRGRRSLQSCPGVKSPTRDHENTVTGDCFFPDPLEIFVVYKKVR
jgi:hypothetical protein